MMDYQAYLKTPHWQKTRKAKLDSVGCQCEKCGRADRVDVHHLTYKRIGKERMADLQVLCPLCHAKAHGKAPDLKDYERINNPTVEESLKRAELRVKEVFKRINF